MKHVQSCLSARKYGEGTFHRSGGLVKLVQACVYVGKTAKAVFTADEVLQSCFKPVDGRKDLIRLI